MRRVLLAAVAATLATSAEAQSVFDGEIRSAPQFLQYRLGGPANETISELAIPVFVVIPIGERFTLDIGTSYASAKVSGDNVYSTISGLTDTQVRGNLTLGSDFIILTAGLNLPTGKSSVTLEEYAASSRIGSDFLSFPISNMGTGFGFTGGVAVARPVGQWNLGVGAAVRRSNAYEPFNIPNQSLVFQPGNEYRTRVGLDRGLGSGHASFGLSYSAFSQDNAGGTSYSSGNRVISQAFYTNPLEGNELTIGAYDVMRMAGQYASGDPSGRENILNLFSSIALHPSGGLLEPSVELRHWAQQIPEVTVGTVVTPARSQTSLLGTLGVRTRVEMRGVTAYQSVGYTFGQLATLDPVGVPTQASIGGFRFQVAMRAAPFAQR